MKNKKRKGVKIPLTSTNWIENRGLTPTHGGKREGAGRPQTTEPTKTIRVPVSLLPKIEQIISKHKAKPFHGFAE